MADNEETLLKEDKLLKRSINRSIIPTENYKLRVFILRTRSLTYYEDKVDRKGNRKEKGRIELKNVRLVEKVDDLMLDNRTNVFQIVYRDNIDTYTLYVVALSKEHRQDWLDALKNECARNDAEFLPVYHKGAWTRSKGKYNCCDQIDRNAPGCEKVEPLISTPVLPGKNKVGSSNFVNRKLPPPPKAPSSSSPNETNVFIAIYDFEPVEDEDLELMQGEEYTVIDFKKEHWWIARDKHGKKGYIPANYIKKKFGLEIHGWYYKDISRSRCEALLKTEKKEGCFLVRDSTTCPGGYTVSVFTGEGEDLVRHYHIKKDAAKEKFYISMSHPFSTIPDLVHYHRYNAGGLATRLREPPDRMNKPTTAGFGHSKWEIDPKDLTYSKVLGSGCFGTVQKGIFKGRGVAVKTLKENSMSDDDFIQEAKTMTTLSHPNLVQLYGIVTKQKPLCIVTELMENGALSTYLKRHQLLLQETSTLLDFGLQICGGMMYLESKNYIHRDLAARNCLVGVNQVVKVADFGLTRYVLDDQYTSSIGSKFPVKWSSPEVLSYSNFSSKSDVWSYGVLLWEIFSGGETPYGKMSNLKLVKYILEKNERLEKPSACPEVLYQKVMRNCWANSPEDRPSFSVLFKTLQGLSEGGDYPHVQ